VVATVAAIIAIGAVPSIAWALWPNEEDRKLGQSSPDPRYATQSGSIERTRETHLRNAADEEVDAAVETCAGLGLAHLAAKYRLSPAPERVAEAFARVYDEGIRERVADGCEHGLREGG
jgi:hypothetical protein